MRLAIVAGTAFIAALIGGAVGAGLVVHPEWFGVSWTSAAPEAEEAERKRAADATRRTEEEARRREEEAARPRTDVEPKPPSTTPEQGQGVTCDYAAPSLKGVFASEADCYYAQRTLTFALTTSRDGAEPATWSNTRSGASGTVRVFYTSREADGTLCRRFEQTVTVKARKASGVGTACFKSNAWQIAP